MRCAIFTPGASARRLSAWTKAAATSPMLPPRPSAASTARSSRTLHLDLDADRTQRRGDRRRDFADPHHDRRDGGNFSSRARAMSKAAASTITRGSPHKAAASPPRPCRSRRCSEIVPGRGRGEIDSEVEIDLEHLAVFALVGEMAMEAREAATLRRRFCRGRSRREKKGRSSSAFPYGVQHMNACTCARTS